MKTNTIATLQLLVAFFLLSLTACSTPYKKYAPPDATKLKASAAKLNTAIKKSQSTAKKAKAKHVEAQQTTDTIKVEQIDLDKKIEELMKNAPDELKPFVKEVQDASKAQTARVETLETQLKEGYALHEELAKDNQAVTAAEGDVHRDGRAYLAGAQTLADDATMEREFRRKAEAQLFKNKLFKWLGGGAIVITIVIAIVLFLAWKGGKLAWKLK